MTTESNSLNLKKNLLKFFRSEKDYLIAAHATTNAKGFDVILENCADTNLGNDLMLLAPNGRIAVSSIISLNIVEKYVN